MPITFVNHTPVQMNSNIISCPSGTKVGDTIIIAYHCICSNNAIESPEFTREQNEGVILYKKAISSDIGANFTISKTAEKFWIVAITIRGAKFHSSKAAYCLRYNCHEVYPPVAGRPWFGICLSYIPQKLEIHNGWNIIRGDDPSESRDIDFFHRITEGTCITPIFVHGPGNLYSKVGVFQFAEDEPKAPFNLIPSGTSSTAPTKVETLTPKITWSFSNADGDNQSAYQVIIREGATEVDNSGKVTNSNPSYTVPANKLRSNTTYNYTVKVWGQADIASPDSTVQYFKTTQAPTATPLSTSTTPAGDIKLSWNYNDAERHLQEKFQVKIYNAEEDEMVLDITKTSSKTFFDLPSSELTAGKEYYWTLQVWDITGMKSNVTAPQYFKTNQAPNAPIDLSPAGPSTNPVKVPTLTPTITWRFTDPDGDRQSAYQVIIREGAVEVDNSGKVTNSTSSYTVPANKLRSNTNYNYTVKVWDQTDEVSQDSAVQYFQTRQAPNAPIDLSPAGPSTNPMKVQTLTPNITWKFTDPDGDRQSAYQVIIREGAVEVDNSGKVTNNTPSYTVPANKLRSNTTYNYTVKVWDQTDEESQDSAVQYFKTRQAPNAPIDLSPAGPSTDPVKVPTLTPTITWKFTDPDGARQSAYQVIIREGAVEVDNSGKVTNSTPSYTVPANKLRSNTTYNYTVKVWDQTDEVSQDSTVQYFKTRQAPTAEPKYPIGPKEDPVRVPTLTPTIKWRYIDPEGFVQEKFQVIFYNAEDDHIVYDTGEILSASVNYVVPAGKLTAGKTYYWKIQVWNINTNSDVTEPQYFKTS